MCPIVLYGFINDNDQIGERSEKRLTQHSSQVCFSLVPNSPVLACKFGLCVKYMCVYAHTEVVLLRTNFNSRGVNSRELFCFFGHSSLSHHAFLMKIGGNASYKPPGPPQTYQEQDLKQQTLVFTLRNIREKSKKLTTVSGRAYIPGLRHTHSLCDTGYRAVLVSVIIGPRAAEALVALAPIAQRGKARVGDCQNALCL